MGYGHLRPAAALGGYLRTKVLEIDRPPLGDGRDQAFWTRVRNVYEPLTRFSQLAALGAPMRALLDTITSIPLPWPRRDLSGPSAGTRWMERAARDGVGQALAAHLRSSGAPFLTTFYAGAILAELHGAQRLHCLITDSDINRVWAPAQPKKSEIRYFAPSERARRRMISYGVAGERISVSGFPLPDELVGEDRSALERNFQRRLTRLEGKGDPPLIVFAVGGAGAQVPLAREIVRGMARQIRDGRLRLALVAGCRPQVAKSLRAAVREAGLAIEVLEDTDVFSYFQRFNQLMANADALWTKPSELTFFAALGLPLIAAPPVGVHEQWNLRWAADRGAALPQHDPELCGEWLLEWLEDGVLAAAAQAGRDRLPSDGLYAIARQMQGA